MTLLHIAVFCGGAILFSVLGRGQWRGWLMLAASVLAIYWLQPLSPIRYLDFWLPTATLGLVVLTWGVTRSATSSSPDSRMTLVTGAVIAGIVMLVGLLRYIMPLCCITPSQPPAVPLIALAVILFVGLAAALMRLRQDTCGLAVALAVLLVGLLIVLKTESLAHASSAWLRALTRQSVERASAFDLRWLGFSYVAFRLLHVLLDWLNERLPALSLQEFVTYVVFFPSLTSGPIDRSDRFVKDMRSPYVLNPSDLSEGGRRIVVGLFRKFVLADSLALIALNGQNAPQTTSTLWLWVLLYAYAFRLYFDFAGYTDIAIGIGRLMGIHLPENFAQPYLKPNLTAFWNSWHITLAQWFRTYYFNPLTRALRSSPHPISVGVIIFVGQLTTMTLIGLWHGVTWNFLIWGVWHGIGLFIHNRWTNVMRVRLRQIEERSWPHRLYTVISVLITFHFVLLGWVWFALPTTDMSVSVILRLFGM